MVGDPAGAAEVEGIAAAVSLILDLALALAEDRRRGRFRKTRDGLDAARARGDPVRRPLPSHTPV